MTWQFNEDDKEKLVSAFESLEVKPDMEDPEAFKAWMLRFARGQDRDAASSAAGKSNDGSSHIVYTPKVSVFSGGTDSKDVPYETWKFEVKTLLQEKVHSGGVITSVAKKSLRGEAAKVVRRLGVLADIYEILDKFDGLYGAVEDAENLLTSFYNSKQETHESVTTWGCRLEDLLDRAGEDEHISRSSVNDMLRTKFWNGLLPHLKEPLRPKKDSILDFDKFRIEARKIERELPSLVDKSHDKGKKPQVKAMYADPDSKTSEYAELKGLVLSINTRLDALESSSATAKPADSGNSYGTYSGNQYQSNGSRFKHPHQGHDRGRSRGRGKFNGSRGGYSTWGQNPRGRSNSQSGKEVNLSSGSTVQKQEITCYRCGQLGHLSIGCRVDISTLHLNEGESA